MKIKKVILLVTMLSSLFGSILHAEEKLPKDKPGTAVFVMSTDDNHRIKVNTDFIEEQGKHLQVELKIPVMNGFKSKIFQSKLNKRIKKDQLYLKSTIEKDVVETYQYDTTKEHPVVPYELMTNYHVKSNRDMFSLEITTYDYRGGAHGMTTRTYYNIDTNTTQIMSLKSYLSKCSGDKDTWYEEVLNKEINRQIDQRRGQGEVFFGDELGFKEIKEDQSFYIDKEGQLVIVFGLYEIAPYAAGIIEFIIPKSIINCYY